MRRKEAFATSGPRIVVRLFAGFNLADASAEDPQGAERVYDIACSDGLTPDPETWRCPDNGARVDLASCAISADVGSGQLSTTWEDPDFDPLQPAFYYIRVLEIPTGRWSTWDAVRTGVPPREGLPVTIQERAWSSPIWYHPSGS